MNPDPNKLTQMPEPNTAAQNYQHHEAPPTTTTVRDSNVSHMNFHQPLHDDHPNMTQPSIQLTPEQFDRLYFQQGHKVHGDLMKRFANPTPLGLLSYSISTLVLSLLFMRIGHVNLNSGAALVGAFYFAGGLGLWVAGLLEFFLGNTFSFTSFTALGSLYFSLAFIYQPIQMINEAFPDGGSRSPLYTGAIGGYLVCWGVVFFVFFICSFKTNLCITLLYLCLTLASFISGGGFYSFARNPISGGHGLIIIRASGCFFFVAALLGFYLFLSSLALSTEFPVPFPALDSGYVFDKKLESPKFFKRKSKASQSTV